VKVVVLRISGFEIERLCSRSQEKQLKKDFSSPAVHLPTGKIHGDPAGVPSLVTERQRRADPECKTSDMQLDVRPGHYLKPRHCEG
jgi:hypothetical protein